MGPSACHAPRLAPAPLPVLAPLAVLLPLAVPAPVAAAAPAEDAPGSPWQLAARTFSLAPGPFAVEDWSSRGVLGGRAVDASLLHASGLGLDLDGELWRVRGAGPSQAVALGDAALAWRAVELGGASIDLLAGARIDASTLPGSAAPLDAWAAPMAGARATLGVADGAWLALRAAAAPDRAAEASWRVSASLRVELSDGWSFVADLRWSSQPALVPGTDAVDGLGRASAWAGFALPF